MGWQDHIPGSPQMTRMQAPNGALPNLQTPPMPGVNINPQGYFPGYTPGNRSSKFTGFDFLSLGAAGKNELTINFSDMITEQAIKEAQDKGKVIEPPSYALTIIPSSSELIALGLEGDSSILNLYYKIQYMYDGAFPSYYEGLFNQPNLYPDARGNAGSAPNFAAAFSANGYKPLSQRGMRILVRGWGFSLSIYGQGSGGLAANWQNKVVRFDAAISPITGQSAIGANADPFEIGNPASGYLPTFSKDVKIITPNGAAAQVFSFIDLGENTVQSYATGDRAIPIPARAVKLTSASIVALFGEISLY